MIPQTRLIDVIPAYIKRKFSKFPLILLLQMDDHRPARCRFREHPKKLRNRFVISHPSNNPNPTKFNSFSRQVNRPDFPCTFAISSNEDLHTWGY